MPRFKAVHKGLKLLPVDFDKQIQVGSFEHAVCYLVEHDLDVDVTVLHARYKNDAEGAPAFDPGVLLIMGMPDEGETMSTLKAPSRARYEAQREDQTAHRVLPGRLGGHRHPTDGPVKKNHPAARKDLQKRVFYTLVSADYRRA